MHIIIARRKKILCESLSLSATCLPKIVLPIMCMHLFVY